jgi:hypothetical protein
VVSPEWLRSPLLGTVLMHELGHAFRGDHHDGSGVMYYGIGDGVLTSCLTVADLDWACSAFACTDFAAECELPEPDSFEHSELAELHAAERAGRELRQGPTSGAPLAGQAVRPH